MSTDNHSSISSQPVPWHGFGKRVATIRAEQGHVVSVITNEPHHQRAQPAHSSERFVRRGDRPMHRSTLTIPTQDDPKYADLYMSNHKKVPVDLFICTDYPSYHYILEVYLGMILLFSKCLLLPGTSQSVCFLTQLLACDWLQNFKLVSNWLHNCIIVHNSAH